MGQEVAEKAGNITERIKRISVGALVVTKVGLSRIGRQRDELGPLSGRRMV